MRFAAPLAGAWIHSHGQVNRHKCESQVYWLGIIHTRINIFFKYFLSTICEFNFLLYVYTIATERYQTNTTIMKTIKVTYIETYIVTEERIVEVSNATFKKLQNEDSEEYQRMYEEMNGVTCAIESPTERDQTFMDIELATEKDIEEVSYTLEF